MLLINSNPYSPLPVNCVRSLLHASRSASDTAPRQCRASGVKRMIGCTPLSSGGRCFSMATTCRRRRRSLTTRSSPSLPSTFNFWKTMSSTLPEVNREFTIKGRVVSGDPNGSSSYWPISRVCSRCPEGHWSTTSVGEALERVHQTTHQQQKL